MHRTVLKCPRQTFGVLFSGSLLQKRGIVNGPHMAESFPSIAGLTGPVSFAWKRESVLGLQIINALQLGHRNQASSLLLELDAANHTMHAEDIIRVLDYCARSPDPLFVMETWRVLQEKNIGLSHKCCMLMIRALCDGGYMEEAFHLLKFLREHHQISFILPLCNYFMSACAKVRDVMHISQCLDTMDYQMLGKNEVTYIVLLKLAVWQKNLSAVHDIWREYNKYYSMNIISLRKFIWSFTRLKDLESAEKALQHMVALALKKGTSLYRSMEGMIHCKHLDMPIPSNGVMSVMDQTTRMGMLEEHKKGPTMKVLRWSFNDVIRACAQCQNGELAERLIMQMRNLGLEPSSHTFDCLVNAVMPGRGVADAMEVLNIMQEWNLKPYDSTLSTLSVGCSRALDLDSAEALLNQIAETPYAHPYNAFLAACDTMDQPERAVKMLAKMRVLKIKPDVRTYELLFSLFGNVNAPYEEGDSNSQAEVTKRTKAIEMDMHKNGIQHSHLSIKNLLKALGTEGMVQELLKYLHAAEKQYSQDNFLGNDIYNTVLHSLVEAKENQMAFQMFKDMKRCGFQPDAATYNIMIDCCSNIRCFKSACALISMMLRDGFYPQTLTYTALIKVLMEYDAFDEALNLLDQTVAEGNESDVVLFNTIILKAGLKERIDVIELVLEVMHREEIQPDPSTCSCVFNAYVNRKFHDTAIEALQVLSMRMISQDHNTLRDVKREYEDYILSEEPEAEMEIMRVFKHSPNLAAALINLRWCSIAGSSIAWTPDQSPWAKRLASTYAARRTDNAK